MSEECRVVSNGKMHERWALFAVTLVVSSVLKTMLLGLLPLKENEMSLTLLLLCGFLQVRNWCGERGSCDFRCRAMWLPRVARCRPEA